MTATILYIEPRPAYTVVMLELPGNESESLWSAEIFRGTDRARITDAMDKDMCEDWVRSWIRTDTDDGQPRKDKPHVEWDYRPLTTDLLGALAQSIAGVGR